MRLNGRLVFFVMFSAWAFLVTPATAQDAKPLVIQGELTAKDPFDKLRKESRAKVHELELKAGEIYLIELKSGDFDTFLRLEDAAGKKISENDDISEKDLNSRLGFAPKKTGTYRAVVTTFKPGLTGKYTLHMETLKKVGEAKVIAAKLTELSAKNKNGKHYQHHKIEFKSGEFWQINLMSKDFDPYLIAISPKKKVIAIDDNAGEGLNARLVLGIADSGEHMLQATAVVVGTNGHYTLQLQRLERTNAVQLTQEERWRQEAEEVNQRGVEHFKATRFAEAVVEFKNSLQLREKLYPKTKYPNGHVDIATSLSNLGRTYQELKDYRQAEPCLQQALQIERQVLGEKHPSFASSLNNLAMLYKEQGDYTKAEPLYQQALEICRKVLGENHPDFATTLNNLATLYNSQANYAEAEPLCQQALKIRRQVFGEKHPAVASSLDTLASLYRAQGNYTKAEPLAQQALEINRKVLGEKHPRFALSLNNLALLYEAQGNHAKAEPVFQQALEVLRSVFGEKHPSFASSLNNLAAVYEARGNYAKAELLFQQALEIRRQVLGEKHPDFARSLANLAALSTAQGNYAKADPLYQQALEIDRKVLGEKHPKFARSLSNLAASYTTQGNYAKAEPLYQQALEIRRQVLGEKHPDFAISLSSLAKLYKKQANYAKAEPLFLKALEIHRQVFGEKHFLYGSTLSHLAELYVVQGNHAKAEPLFRQSLEIARHVRGEKHREYAAGLNNLAALYSAQGNHVKAEPLFQQALEIDRTALGEKHPSFALNLQNLAFSHLNRGQPMAAESLGRQAVLIIAEHLEATAVVQTEQGQTTFLSKQRSYLDTYLSYSAAAKTSAVDAYAMVLPWKGAVTHRQRVTRFARTTLADTDKDTIALFAKLEEASRHYANLINRPVESKTAGDLPKRLSDLNAEREKLEIELARRTEAFRKLRQAKQMTPSQFQKSLPEGTVFVDFLVYRKRKPRQNVVESLVAFVVTPTTVARIELGTLEPTTKAIDAFLLTLKRGQPVPGENDPALFLRDKLWQPIAKHVDGAKLLLIAPDGPLCRLPFGALPGKAAGKYLIEEIPIAVIPVPQMLPELLANAATNDTSSLLVVGDVDFDAIVGKPAKGTGPSELTRVFADAAERSGKSLQWTRLPGTLGEMNSIEKLFRVKSPKAPLTVLKSEHATEAALRGKAPQHAYLHLATHGFFAPPQVKRMHVVEGKDDFERDKRPVIGHLPSLLSGLVLAGANRPGSGDDDGILTALEVGELDLSKVRLAVLSACETGLGETAGGEGVLGLQRAFQIAGAQTTVTTLWSIPDEPTRVLMERFYENHWAKKMGKLDALIEAQQWMLREGRSHAGVQRGIQRLEKTPEPVTSGRLPPYYWAAFVLSGDWR